MKVRRAILTLATVFTLCSCGHGDEITVLEAEAIIAEGKSKIQIPQVFSYHTGDESLSQLTGNYTAHGSYQRVSVDQINKQIYVQSTTTGRTQRIWYFKEKGSYYQAKDGSGKTTISAGTFNERADYYAGQLRTEISNLWINTKAIITSPDPYGLQASQGELELRSKGNGHLYLRYYCSAPDKINDREVIRSASSQIEFEGWLPLVVRISLEVSWQRTTDYERTSMNFQWNKSSYPGNPKEGKDYSSYPFPIY